jgi:DNA-directed RNA polymerase specialized sigma24 family protein
VPDRLPETFADFVARERADLLRLAVLLEDDRVDAEELLRRVLVGVRARWRRLPHGDPLAEARRLLVRRVLGRRAGRGPRTSGWVDEPSDAWDTSRLDDLRQALSALPVPTRVAVVLSVWAGLPDRQIGDLLRAPEDVVRGEVVAGTAPLRAALAPVPLVWSATPRLPGDDELSAELTELADDGTPAADDDAATAAAEAEHEVAARRRLRWPLAIAAVAAAVVVAVPALSGDSVTANEDAPPTARARPSAAEPREVELARLPTRGSLAHDEAFLAGIVEQPWENEYTGDYPMDVNTPEDSRRVLYAGDVPAGRWALVVGRPEPVDPVQEGIGGPFITDELFMAWFTGPRGAGPEDMVMATYPYGLMPDMFPALLDPPSGTMVVLAAPGDEVEVSPRVEVAADARDSRTWTSVPVADGIALARLDPVDLPWTWAVNYRVVRDGTRISASPPDGMMQAAVEPGLPDLGIEYPTGKPDADGRRAARWAAFIALSSLGAPTDDTRVIARVVQQAPAGGTGTVALVTVTLPSGAVLVSAQWAWEVSADFPGAADCGLEVRPASPPPDERLLFAGCETFDPDNGEVMGNLLVGSVPRQVAAVRLYGGDGAFVEEHPVHDGTLVVQVPPGIDTVEAVTASGVSLGRSHLLGHWSPTTD